MVRKIEHDNRIEYTNENGIIHRDDGPAVIYPDGSQFWLKDGKFHRDDGPAVIFPSGTKMWYKNGLRHREDGPAVIYANGKVFWLLNGNSYSFKEWIKLVNISDEEKMELALRYG